MTNERIGGSDLFHEAPKHTFPICSKTIDGVVAMAMAMARRFVEESVPACITEGA